MPTSHENITDRKAICAVSGPRRRIISATLSERKKERPNRRGRCRCTQLQILQPQRIAQTELGHVVGALLVGELGEALRPEDGDQWIAGQDAHQDEHDDRNADDRDRTEHQTTHDVAEHGTRGSGTCSDCRGKHKSAGRRHRHVVVRSALTCTHIGMSSTGLCGCGTEMRTAARSPPQDERAPLRTDRRERAARVWKWPKLSVPRTRALSTVDHPGSRARTGVGSAPLPPIPSPASPQQTTRLTATGAADTRWGGRGNVPVALAMSLKPCRATWCPCARRRRCRSSPWDCDL